MTISKKSHLALALDHCREAPVRARRLFFEIVIPLSFPKTGIRPGASPGRAFPRSRTSQAKFSTLGWVHGRAKVPARGLGMTCRNNHETRKPELKERSRHGIRHPVYVAPEYGRRALSASRRPCARDPRNPARRRDRLRHRLARP